MKYSKCLNLLFFLLFFACQEQKKRETVVKNVEDSLCTSFQDKLAKLSIHYKHCNPTFLSPSDNDLSYSCGCNDILKISREKLLKIGLDSILAPYSVNKGYSFHRFSNGFNLLGIANNLDGGSSLVDFYLFDNNGRYINNLFSLFSAGDAGSNHQKIAFFKNDTFDIHQFDSSPSFENTKAYFSYKNFLIYFKNNKIL